MWLNGIDLGFWAGFGFPAMGKLGTMKDRLECVGICDWVVVVPGRIRQVIVRGVGIDRG